MICYLLEGLRDTKMTILIVFMAALTTISSLYALQKWGWLAFAIVGGLMLGVFTALLKVIV